MFNDVSNFHKKFDLKPTDKPSLLPRDVMAFRLKCLREEIDELNEAYYNKDLAETADALVDLIYFALGTAYLMRLPFPALWNEVHAANMRKVKAKSASDSKRSHASDVIKPKGWQHPNIKHVLDNPCYSCDTGLICFVRCDALTKWEVSK